MTLNNLINGISLAKNYFGVVNGSIFKDFDVDRITHEWTHMDKTIEPIANGVYDILNAFSDEGIGAGMSKTFSVLKDGISSLVAAHPVITSIGAIIAGFNVMYAPVLDGAKKLEQASKAVGDYQNTVSELESVKQELENINVRMDELNAKGHLTLVESEEIEKLTRSNDELERRKNILETLKKGQFAAAKNEVNDYLSDKSTANQNFKLINPYTWKNSS